MKMPDPTYPEPDCRRMEVGRCSGLCKVWTCEHCGAPLKIHHLSFGDIYQCGYMPCLGDKSCKD